MGHPTNVIDFALYRKRRQARRLGEAMWALYAWRNAQSCLTALPIGATGHCCQA